MKLRFILVTMLFALTAVSSYAQKKDADKNADQNEYDENYEFKESANVKMHIGLGMGIDYGGFGGKLSVNPIPQLAIFGGLGYNLNGAGYNVGVTGRFLPESKVCPFVSFMYGYNAVVKIQGRSSENKTYYGTSLGTGIELNTRNGKFWNFELLIPFRSKAYSDHVDRLLNDPSIEMTEPLPIAISVGYHFPL